LRYGFGSNEPNRPILSRKKPSRAGARHVKGETKDIDALTGLVSAIPLRRRRPLKGDKGREENPRLILMPSRHERMAEFEKATGLPRRLREEIEQIFVSATFFTGKDPRIEGWRGPKAALGIVQTGEALIPEEATHQAQYPKQRLGAGIDREVRPCASIKRAPSTAVPSVCVRGRKTSSACPQARAGCGRAVEGGREPRTQS
jgi:hypothetical protein